MMASLTVYCRTGFKAVPKFADREPQVEYIVTCAVGKKPSGAKKLRGTCVSMLYNTVYDYPALYTAYRLML